MNARLIFALVTLFAGSVVLESARAQEWNYEQQEHWSGVCASGTEQSPIALSTAHPLSHAGDGVRFRWGQGPFAAPFFDGHTLKFTAPAGNITQFGTDSFQLLQWHIHRPSEHVVDGVRYPAELHFVHQNAATGQLRVIGVFAREGGFNSAFEEQLRGSQEGPEALLPPRLARWSYHGSLTTPPCSEGVLWDVLQEPVELSHEQLVRLDSSVPLANARVLQATNGRAVIQEQN